MTTDVTAALFTACVDAPTVIARPLGAGGETVMVRAGDVLEPDALVASTVTEKDPAAL
jgi:hypothetical protein